MENCNQISKGPEIGPTGMCLTLLQRTGCQGRALYFMQNDNNSLKEERGEKGSGEGEQNKNNPNNNNCKQNNHPSLSQELSLTLCLKLRSRRDVPNIKLIHLRSKEAFQKQVLQ